jgi:hypothetical protein
MRQNRFPEVILRCQRFKKSSIPSAPYVTQLGEFVAAAGVAKANRELVADQLAATTGEDARTAGEACPLLLAFAGGEPSHEVAVWEYVAADRGAARGKHVEDGSKVRMVGARV